MYKKMIMSLSRLLQLTAMRLAITGLLSRPSCLCLAFQPSYTSFGGPTN
jgi:hypothetical protein